MALSITSGYVEMTPYVMVGQVSRPRVISVIGISPLIVKLKCALTTLPRRVLPVPAVPPSSFPSFIATGVLKYPFPVFSVFGSTVALL